MINRTDIPLSVWINGGGPFLCLGPGQSESLELKHIDPNTTRGIISWGATFSTKGRAYQLAAGQQRWPMREDIVIGAENGVLSTHDGLTVYELIRIVNAQAMWRAKLHRREEQTARARRRAALRIQAVARGRLERKLSQCMICADETPFRSLVSTVPSQVCHRTCRSCATRWVDSAITDGKLYIRCPGVDCKHLMDPEKFATPAAEAQWRESLHASHHTRLVGESDQDFLKFARDYARACPACGVLIFRHAGCNHMQCRCGTQFDWNDAATRVRIPTKDGVESVSMGVFGHGKHLMQAEANTYCIDCNASCKQDPWVSLSLGVMLCIDCAGWHRSLVQSNIRSLALDTLAPADITLLERTGNRKFATSNPYGADWAAMDLSAHRAWHLGGTYEYRREVVRIWSEARADWDAEATALAEQDTSERMKRDPTPSDDDGNDFSPWGP